MNKSKKIKIKNSNGMKNILLKVSLFIFLVLIAVSPMIASAQAAWRGIDPRLIPVCIGNGIGNLICRVHQILNSIIPVLVALGVIYLVWGIVQYFIKSEEEAKKKGKDRIIFGIVGLAVIVGLWGLVNVVVTTFNLGGQRAPDLTNLVAVPTTESSACKIGGKFQGVLDYVTCIIGKSVIPFIFAIAMVMFIWGAVKFFIIEADEEAKRAQGKQFMIWGIIALTVMISVWGLVGILTNTFFGSGVQVLPQLPTTER